MSRLNEMNEKQRLKEYKRLAKELKNKDTSVREAAIKTAFEDTRYLLDGKGVCSLIEGVAAKKVCCDTTHAAITFKKTLYITK